MFDGVRAVMTVSDNSKISDNSKPKTCKSCHEQKTVSDFYGYNKKCKVCFSRDCQIRKAKKLSDPIERDRRNAMERASRARRIAADPGYRVRETEGAARRRAVHAAANPKPPKPLTLREIAASNGLDRYIPDKPCKKGHLTERSVKTGACMECGRNSANEYMKRNRELVRLKEREKYASNPDAIRARKKEYDDRNRELINARARARVGEKTREACREYYAKNKEERAEYRRKNRGRYAMHANNRRDKVARATPIWANMDEIAAIYEEAARISDATGVQHDVDHYYPLLGRTCSGLHVANNLRIIPHDINLKKHNKMPDEINDPF